MLFDLGLRKDEKGYPQGAQFDADDLLAECAKDVAEQLRDGGVEPGEIRRIVYSHLHFDHVGDPSPFTNAVLTFGHESKDMVERADTGTNDFLHPFPKNLKRVYVDFHSESTTTTAGSGPSVLSGKVSPLGSFPRAIDVHEDGSMYLLDAPGHMPGHLAVLARVSPSVSTSAPASSSGPAGSFILLAGDTCHDRQCYLRTQHQATAGDPESHRGTGPRPLAKDNYADVAEATRTVGLLTRMSEEPGVVVVLAHDKACLVEEPKMPLFPDDLCGWARRKGAKVGE